MYFKTYLQSLRIINCIDTKTYFIRGEFDMNRQLYKSKSNKVFSGVCGGIAEYFRMDPSLVRVVWVLISLALAAGFGGLIIYIIAAIIIPEGSAGFSNFKEERNSGDFRDDDNAGNSGDEWKSTTHYDNGKGKLIIGAGLILVGLFAMFKQIFPRIDLDFFWPIILMGIGVLIIFKGRWGKYE